jgi:hypothetical protein
MTRFTVDRFIRHLIAILGGFRSDRDTSTPTPACP